MALPVKFHFLVIFMIYCSDKTLARSATRLLSMRFHKPYKAFHHAARKKRLSSQSIFLKEEKFVGKCIGTSDEKLYPHSWITNMVVVLIALLLKISRLLDDFEPYLNVLIVSWLTYEK